jgi:hypothetical protein
MNKLGLDRATHSLKAVTISAAIAAILAPVMIGVLVSLQGGITRPMALFMPIAYLFGTLMLMPHVLFVTFGLAFVFGSALSLLRIRSPILYAISGMAVSWFSFVLSFGKTADFSTASPVLMPDRTVSGLIGFGVAGAINGLIYWWLAGRLTGKPRDGA